MQCSHVMSHCVKVPYKRTKHKNKNLFYYYVLMCIVIGLYGTLWCGCTASILNQALYLSQNHLFLRTPGRKYLTSIHSCNNLLEAPSDDLLSLPCCFGGLGIPYPVKSSPLWFHNSLQSLLLLLILFLIKMTQCLLSLSHIRQQPKRKVILPG